MWLKTSATYNISYYCPFPAQKSFHAAAGPPIDTKRQYDSYGTIPIIRVVKTQRHIHMYITAFPRPKKLPRCMPPDRRRWYLPTFRQHTDPRRPPHYWAFALFPLFLLQSTINSSTDIIFIRKQENCQYYFLFQARSNYYTIIILHSSIMTLKLYRSISSFGVSDDKPKGSVQMM